MRVVVCNIAHHDFNTFVSHVLHATCSRTSDFYELELEVFITLSTLL